MEKVMHKKTTLLLVCFFSVPMLLAANTFIAPNCYENGKTLRTKSTVLQSLLTHAYGRRNPFEFIDTAVRLTLELQATTAGYALSNQEPIHAEHSQKLLAALIKLDKDLSAVLASFVHDTDRYQPLKELLQNTSSTKEYIDTNLSYLAEQSQTYRYQTQRFVELIGAGAMVGAKIKALISLVGLALSLAVLYRYFTSEARDLKEKITAIATQDGGFKATRRTLKNTSKELLTKQERLTQGIRNNLLRLKTWCRNGWRRLQGGMQPLDVPPSGIFAKVYDKAQERGIDVSNINRAFLP